MAKIRAGILSNVHGAVGGVVGGVWKGTNYLRARVKPANPDTDNQRVQRGKMSQTVAFAKSVLGPVIQPFIDPFVKGMSGYNMFVKRNIDVFEEPVDYSKIVLTQGTLFNGGIETFTRSGAAASLDPSTNNGTNGLSTDKCYAVIRVASTGVIVEPESTGVRAGSTLEFSDARLLADSDWQIWVWFWREDAKTGAITMVSDSAYTLSEKV